MAAVDYFIKFDGIKGESTDAKHKDEIDIESWSWGETQSGAAAHGGGGGAGKVAMQDFHFVMKLNKASAALMKACATGQHIKGAVLTARKAGKDQQEYLTIKLTDVLVSSYQTGAGPRATSCRPTRCRSTSRRSRSTTSRRSRTARLAPVSGSRSTSRRTSPSDGERRAPEPVRVVRPAARPEPPRVESTDAGVELARLLRRAGYEAPRIQERLATGDQLLARSPELPSYLRRLGDADELAVLLRLFLLGVPVARARFDELVGAELRSVWPGPGCSWRTASSSTARRASSRTTSC